MEKAVHNYVITEVHGEGANPPQPARAPSRKIYRKSPGTAYRRNPGCTDRKETVVCEFIDIEGAFNNTLHE